MLDQLIGPLSAHINGILSQPVTGTDDQVMHVDTKRAYITLLNNIMASKLHGIFTSARTYNGPLCFPQKIQCLYTGNQPQLESLLASMQQLAEDVSDSSSQRAAFQFLSRCVQVWVPPIQPVNGDQNSAIPGFERFVYERLIPAAFSVLASPQFNIKDGQMLVVSILSSTISTFIR